MRRAAMPSGPGMGQGRFLCCASRRPMRPPTHEVIKVMRSFVATLVAGAALLGAGSASAQMSSYRSATASAGKPTLLWTLTAIKKDCSIGEIGGVRVVSPPKNGTLTLAKAKVKSPSSFRCPNLETPVERVVYVPKAKFTGADEVSFETKNADGVVEKHTIKIDVSDKPAPAKKDDAVNL